MKTYSELGQHIDRLGPSFPWIKVAKYFDRVDSTQKRVLQWLPKEADGAVLVMAETQTQGEGRQGRTWISPPGGVWFTLAFPLKNLSLEQVAPFSMVAALSLADSLQEVNNLDCELKWPNDVLVKGKKIAGILLTTTTKFKHPWLLVGVGINVNNDLPFILAKEATSIKLIRGQSQGRTRLIESILHSLQNAWEEFDRTGFGPYHKAFEGRLSGVGSVASVAAGTKTFKGTLIGVDPQGALLLKSGAGTQKVHAGEIVGTT